MLIGAGDGAELYREVHEADRPWAQLLLVHGLGEHVGRWRRTGAWLAARGLRVSGVDLRGHGRSPGARGRARFARLIDDLAEHHARLGKERPELPIQLWGHSLGGALGLLFALRRRPRLEGLVISAPALRPAFEPTPWKVAVARVAARIWPGLRFDNELDTRALSRDPEVRRAYHADPLVHQLVSAGLAVDALDGGEWALERAARLGNPALLMHGTADRLTSVEASRTFVERGALAELREWPGFFHELHHEPERESVLEEAVAWLRKRAAG